MAHRLFLLRHGQTEWSARGQHTGRTDVPLTSAGEDQARAAGATLRALQDGPVLTLSSPRGRAVRTAELAGLQISETTETLAEWDYGDYEGVTTDTIRQSVPQWTVWTHPILGGESAEQVGARADQILARVRTLLTNTEVVLVGHGHFSRIVISRWIGLPASSGGRFRLDPAGVAVLGHERGTPQIQHLNLPPD